MRKQGGEEENKALPLFETKEARFRVAYKLYESTIFVCICLIWVYRFRNIPTAGGTVRYWAWIGVLVCEIGFGLYWILTPPLRWRIAFQAPFKDRLLLRYSEDKLPAMDIFVCTADPRLEPPCMVINTILSAMALNYPSKKLNVYLSDDGGSELTFYALIKASIFAKHWLPFCRRFNVEPRSPEAYLAGCQNSNISTSSTECGRAWLFVKKLYEEMKRDIELAVAKGKLPEGARNQHKGFSEWNLKTTMQDHQSIVQIIIDGRDTNATDEDGFQLPTVVYMAREKRPNCPHHFKAGALNALIRVSSKISNAPFILNLDCDMYPSNADIIKETLCFFMDEAEGHDIAYVQFPVNFNNLTKNDPYANNFPAVTMVDTEQPCTAELGVSIEEKVCQELI